MCAPDHGNIEKAPVQICEYVIPSPPGAKKACIAEKPTPKPRGTEFHYNTHLLQSLI